MFAKGYRHYGDNDYAELLGKSSAREGVILEPVGESLINSAQEIRLGAIPKGEGTGVPFSPGRRTSCSPSDCRDDNLKRRGAVLRPLILDAQYLAIWRIPSMMFKLPGYGGVLLSTRL
ncbi:PREDICTED: uncharacterized protein LOC105560825 [Vollenhovia emeryi]|uniref:uncharacterized protein LOC105560825 n=1 Tax=Vollenhovia emeryi TaxID=411798 RepID=UPI0005F43C56|nr:PREDICTED: uncharacterized protein LOC105560825 [Vollenhovia emeryi]